MTDTPIRKLLIANRGEIARRVIRTCRRLGIESVAVFSDVDEAMPFVREADEAVRIGAAAAKESYLNQRAILDAAKRTGVDAVHPGYGFLAENAEFARAVRAAGLIFVGPSSATIRAVGAKREAKATMMAAGVPVVPGYDGSDPAAYDAEAKRVGYPLLIKASAGGGGKGMKRVDGPSELEAAVESARREAKKAFGDEELIFERYIEGGRHIEVQIAGDVHGNVVHLHERDCSVQRRHQKVVEESPAPGLSNELRSAIHAAAINVGKAVSYTNVGTVEFIVQGDDFFFLEVNARLQVEHAVTEEVLGIDLVEWQIALAEGDAMPPVPPPIGASMEARIYAEDANFLPQIGQILDWHFDDDDAIRVESAVEEGSVVGVHYDPMLAKVIATGATRKHAIARLRHALRQSSLLGVTTNRDFLVAILDDATFAQGGVNTDFLSERSIRAASHKNTATAIVAATMNELRRLAEERPHLPKVALGFSNNPRFTSPETWSVDSDEFAVSWRRERDGSFLFRVDDHEISATFVEDTIEVNGRRFSPRVRWRLDEVFVSLLGECFVLKREPRLGSPVAAQDPAAVVSPMPGTVVAVEVAEGDQVKAGTALVVVEAMKMEHVLVAAQDGIVREIRAKAGDAVEAGALLVRVE